LKSSITLFAFSITPSSLVPSHNPAVWAAPLRLQGGATLTLWVLKKEPDQRWQTAAEFRDALIWCQPNRAIIANSAALPLRTVETRSAPDVAARRWQRYVQRRPVVAAAIAALVVLIAGMAASAFWLGSFAFKGSRTTRDQASIAVLPFTDMSPDKNQEYFSDGLAEELLNGLAKIPGLRVSGRTSAFQFKGKTEDSRTIGKKLNVATLLEGSVRRQGYMIIMYAHAASVPLETATPSEINSDPNRLFDRLGLAQTDENLDTGGTQRPRLPKQGQPPPDR
jgi:TolB-like protein